MAEIDYEKMPPNQGEQNAANFNMRFKKYVSALTTLNAMAVEAGRWADGPQTTAWIQALQKLASERAGRGGNVLWLELEKFAGTLVFYSLGVQAIAAQNHQFLKEIFVCEIFREHRENLKAIECLPPALLFQQRTDKWIEGYEQRKFPMSDWLCDWLRPLAIANFANEKEYLATFDKFEILIALSYLQSKRETHLWCPVGSFQYRSDSRERVVQSLWEEVQRGPASSIVRSNLFGDSGHECMNRIEEFKEFMKTTRFS